MMAAGTSHIASLEQTAHEIQHNQQQGHSSDTIEDSRSHMKDEEHDDLAEEDYEEKLSESGSGSGEKEEHGETGSSSSGDKVSLENLVRKSIRVTFPCEESLLMRGFFTGWEETGQICLDRCRGSDVVQACTHVWADEVDVNRTGVEKKHPKHHERQCPVLPTLAPSAWTEAKETRHRREPVG
tara:strand:- start:109 stop:657 length:549 start_codon:yes stop_codon:yes gene_type:complete